MDAALQEREFAKFSRMEDSSLTRIWIVFRMQTGARFRESENPATVSLRAAQHANVRVLDLGACQEISKSCLKILEYNAKENSCSFVNFISMCLSWSWRELPQTTALRFRLRSSPLSRKLGEVF